MLAPDPSFVVFGRDPSVSNGLFVSFAIADGWSRPAPLHQAGIESRLDPNGSVLYFTAADRCVHATAAPHR